MKGNKKTEYIVVRVTPEQKEKIKAKAEANGMTVSQFILFYFAK